MHTSDDSVLVHYTFSGDDRANNVAAIVSGVIVPLVILPPLTITIIVIIIVMCKPKKAGECIVVLHACVTQRLQSD